MAEEFQESDVVFSDHHHDNNGYFTYQELVVSTVTQGGHGARNSGNYNCKKKKKKSQSNSVPVNINVPNNLFQYVDTDDFEEEYEDGEIIPPHVTVGRRFFAGKMAFSVCTGNGRTLKGRDLSQVRNSILRMTGFLET